MRIFDPAPLRCLLGLHEWRAVGPVRWGLFTTRLCIHCHKLSFGLRPFKKHSSPKKPGGTFVK